MSNNVWLSSDWHFGHRLVAGLRGFGEDTASHDQSIVDTISSQVSKGDNIWFLGDLSVSFSKYALSLVSDMRDNLGVKLHMIAGNHDACSPIHRDSYKYQAKFLEAFDSVQAYAKRKINDQYVMLSHYPYFGDHGEDRYSEFRLRDTGLPVIHGHTHSAEKVSRSTIGTLQVHVGYDAWSNLVSLTEVTRMIENDSAA